MGELGRYPLMLEVLLNKNLTSTIDSKMQTDMIVLDFAKAFDKVSHPRLLHKLRHYGIKGKNNQWITAFLESRTQEFRQYPVVF
jgi:hypothetical protein